MASTFNLRMAAENEEKHPGIDAQYDDKREFYVHEMFDKVREVKDLVTSARLQAQEADIRVKFAAAYAERAISEAKAVHEVAGTLAKTSRVIAALALEFANTTDASLEAAGEGEHVNSFSFVDSDISKAGESSFEASFEIPFSSPEFIPSAQKGYPKASTSFPGTGNAYKKYNIIYPEELSPEETTVDKASGTNSLPIVWEDSYSAGWESKPVSWSEKKNNNKLKHKIYAYKKKSNDSVNSSTESDSFTEPEEEHDRSAGQTTYAEHWTQTTAKDETSTVATEDTEVDGQVKLKNIGEITLSLNAVVFDTDEHDGDDRENNSESLLDSDDENDFDKENESPRMEEETRDGVDDEKNGEAE